STRGKSGQFRTARSTRLSGACNTETDVVVLVRRVVVVAVGGGQVVGVVVPRPATQPPRRTGESVPVARFLPPGIDLSGQHRAAKSVTLRVAGIRHPRDNALRDPRHPRA